MHYKYEKRCGKCSVIYFSKLISKDQFDNICDNPNITITSASEKSVAEIQSICEECANKKD